MARLPVGRRPTLPRPPDTRPPYGDRGSLSTKAALNSLTESLRLDLAREHPGIRVLLVLPGVVATDFGANAVFGGPDSRTLPGAQPVDEVARIVADAMRGGPADAYTRADGLDHALGYLRGLAAR